MKAGSLESPVLVENTWAVCSDSGELGSAQTSITINGLNGNVDEEYRLIIRAVGGSVGDTHYKIRPNNDSGANYGRQNLYGSDATASASRVTTDTDVQVTIDANPQNNLQFSDVIFYAKSGYVRTFICKVGNAITGTTVTDVGLQGNSWNNTADNITSLVVLANQTSGIGIGSRIILLKKVTNTTGLKTGSLEVQGKVYGVWQKVYEDTLASAQTSVTISGLDGNTDVMYRVVVRVISAAGYAGNEYVKPNNDTGSNYGFQHIYGSNASVTAARTTASNGGLWLLDAGASDRNFAEMLIYAKSGYIRTGINVATSRITGTTVSDLHLKGVVWNNTTDNITSLVLGTTQASGWDVGTYICLEKLVLS